MRREYIVNSLDRLWLGNDSRWYTVLAKAEAANGSNRFQNGEDQGRRDHHGGRHLGLLCIRAEVREGQGGENHRRPAGLDPHSETGGSRRRDGLPGSDKANRLGDRGWRCRSRDDLERYLYGCLGSAPSGCVLETEGDSQ